MANAKLNNWMQYVLLVGVVLTLLVSWGAMGYAYDANKQVDTDDIADKVASKLDVSVEFVVNDTLTQQIHEKVLEEDLTEDKAEELARDEMDTKDFLREVFDELEDEGVDIESYKDITDLRVIDSETSVSGDSAEVTLEVKVYYFLDGDEEEEEKARITATFDIEDLDPEEGYEDAEVDDFEVEVEKIYE